MCGIAGIVNLTGELAREEDIREMCDAIRHRGPDDDGYLVDGSVALGNRRLAIIDLSPKGRQPIWNEDRTMAIVHNGEVYNHQDIRRELKQLGHVFFSETDTEVILHAYEEWGDACVQRFNGMWAFAVYDLRNKELFVSRDRFGVKPLYYYRDHSRLLFCSEIRGLLTQGVRRAPDDQTVFDFLLYNLLDHCERTFFAGVFRLLPGHNLRVRLNGGSLDFQKWYNVHSSPMEGGDSRERVQELLTDSIRLRLIADVPVGSCLSGGLDSSSIVCLMRQLAPAHEIRTFSAIFPGTSVDEEGYAREVIGYAKVNPFFVSPRADELLEDVQDLIRSQEEPFFGTSLYAQYRVMKLAHENGMKVLLDGQGSDEMFAGYHSYFGFYFYELLRNWKWLRMLHEMRGYLRVSQRLLPFEICAYRLLPSALRKAARRRRFAGWMNPDFYERHVSGWAGSEYGLRASGTLNDELKEAVLQTSIPQLLRHEDKNSMRWSIESRVPFLDYRLVEYALALPSEHKILNGETKSVFRRAMQNILPERIRNRTDKIGFATPEDLWMKNRAVKTFFEGIVNSNAFRQRCYWNAEKLQLRLQGFVKGLNRDPQEFWKVMCTELWLREFMD